MKKNGVKRFFLPFLALFGVSLATSISLETKDVYSVQAVSSSKVDSRFFIATTSKPWTYTDYQGNYYDGCDITVTGDSLLSTSQSGRMIITRPRLMVV